MTQPHDTLDTRVQRALEQAPRYAIPADFAARTAATALAQFGPLKPAAPAWRFSRVAIRIGFAALILVMLWLAPLAQSNGRVPVAFESLFALEFVALASWFSLRNTTSV